MDTARCCWRWSCSRACGGDAGPSYTGAWGTESGDDDAARASARLCAEGDGRIAGSTGGTVCPTGAPYSSHVSVAAVVGGDLCDFVAAAAAAAVGGGCSGGGPHRGELVARAPRTGREVILSPGFCVFGEWWYQVLRWSGSAVPSIQQQTKKEWINPFLKKNNKKRRTAIESLLGKKNRSGNCLFTWLCVLFCDAFKNMCTSISHVANGYAYNNTRFCIRE